MIDFDRSFEYLEILQEGKSNGETEFATMNVYPTGSVRKILRDAADFAAGILKDIRIMEEKLKKAERKNV